MSMGKGVGLTAPANMAQQCRAEVERDRQCFRLTEDIDHELEVLAGAINELGAAIAPCLIQVPERQDDTPKAVDGEIRSEVSVWMSRTLFKVNDLKKTVESMTRRCTL